MNKIAKTVLLTLALSSSVFAFAGKDDDVVIREAANKHVQVDAVKTLADETSVTLTGTLIKYLGNEYYEFKDETGSISLEIDDDIWGVAGLKVGDQVKVIGEVDTHHQKPTDIEVVKIEKITK